MYSTFPFSSFEWVLIVTLLRQDFVSPGLILLPKLSALWSASRQLTCRWLSLSIVKHTVLMFTRLTQNTKIKAQIEVHRYIEAVIEKFKCTGIAEEI
jgi:hypothetical protein